MYTYYHEVTNDKARGTVRAPVNTCTVRKECAGVKDRGTTVFVCTHVFSHINVTGLQHTHTHTHTPFIIIILYYNYYYLRPAPEPRVRQLLLYAYTTHIHTPTQWYRGRHVVRIRCEVRSYPRTIVAADNVKLSTRWRHTKSSRQETGMYYYNRGGEIIAAWAQTLMYGHVHNSLPPPPPTLLRPANVIVACVHKRDCSRAYIIIITTL